MNEKLKDTLALVGIVAATYHTMDVATKMTNRLIKKHNDKKNKSKESTEIVIVEDYTVVE